MDRYCFLNYRQFLGCLSDLYLGVYILYFGVDMLVGDWDHEAG
jgi:hypothetical protein